MPARAASGDFSSRAASRGRSRAAAGARSRAVPDGSSPGAGQGRPVLVTCDEALLDDVVRLGAIAGTEVEVVPDPAAARPLWMTAPLVIVGGDVAASCVRAGLPRRRDLALVASVGGVALCDAAGASVTGAAGAVGAAGGPEEGIWELATEIGADQVVALPEAESWLVRRLAESLTTPAAGRVVAVVPGSGGAGASVLAAGLAVTAVRHGVRPMLVDADPLGGGLDVLLGWEERDGMRWPDLAEASGAMSVDGLYSALPHSGDLVVLSWDRTDSSGVPVSAVDAVLDAGRRGSDLVVVDLPRRLDDAAVRVLRAADLVLLVARPNVRACAAAARTAGVLTLHCSAVEVVVRGPAPGNLRAKDVSETLRLPLAASLRPEVGLPAALDRGEAPAGNGRGPLAVLCRRLLSRLDVTGVAA